MFRKFAIATVVAAICAGAFAGTSDRVSATKKGSVLVFPKIEVRWDAAGNLKADTFISISNDYIADLHLVMYYVMGDLNCANRIYNDIDLTRNQPAYWSVASGMGSINVAPFFSFANAYPDPNGSSDQVVRGFLVIYAAGQLNRPIKWNHLSGVATLVNYANVASWEYNAYAFAALQPATGGLWNNGTGEAVPNAATGELNFDGTEYDFAFDQLLFDFIANGAGAYSYASVGQVYNVAHDTDMTLLVNDMDFTLANAEPKITYATISIWNADEFSYATAVCVPCWYSSLTSRIGGAFNQSVLHTANGRARIDGVANDLCDVLDGTTVLYDTAERAMLGVVAKVLTFSGTVTGVDVAGTNMVGSGTEAACLHVDVITEPPPEKAITGPGAGVKPMKANNVVGR